MSLVTTIDQLQAAGLTLDENSDITVLQPHLDSAEKNFLLPILGKEFYDEIIEELEAGTPDPQWQALLPYLQKPIAWNGFYLFFKKPVGNLSHSGFFKNRFEHTEAPAKWEIDQIKDDLICNADLALDELIAFLREKSTDYPTWGDSEYFASNAGRIITTPAQFNQYVNIGCSGRVFQRLLYYRNIAERNIGKSVCNALHLRIQNELAGDPAITPAITALLDYLRPVVAFETMKLSIVMIPFFQYNGGLYSWTYADGTLTKTALTGQQTREMAAQYAEQYEHARDELLAFLKRNIEDYPEYAASDCYASGQKTLIVQYPNDYTKKHWGL